MKQLDVEVNRSVMLSGDAPAAAAGPRSLLSRTALLTAIAPLTWGTTYLVTTELLPPGHPLWSGVLRALPAGLLALAIGRTLPRGHWWWRSLLLGTLNIGAFFPLLFLAAYLLPGGVAGVFGATGPLLVAMLAAVLLGERPTARRLTWGVLAALGVAAMALGPDAALNPLGILAALAGVLSMALGTVLSARWRPPVGPVTFAGWQLTAGGLVIAPLALAVEGAPPALDAAALLGYTWLTLVGGLLAYVLWFRGLGAMPTGAAAFLPVLSPLVAAALGFLVLGEQLTAVQGAGFALALVAVVAAQGSSRAKKVAE
ncbi:EamA family transporter [Brachybacterium sp. FME24]|uniref:EamA family transporter n=1 Tax=Brachybacterium sp. FME24 TaxID=2742605 RepID=UPI001D051B33|nr:EamA family transporter [Brachybacterium sp. FME24]